MGRCCEDVNDPACLVGTSLWDTGNGRLAVFHSKSSAFRNPLVAVGQCPQKASQCGGVARKDVNTGFFDAEESTITMEGSYAASDSGCSFAIMAQCGGAPGWAIDYAQTTLTDDDAHFLFLEYSGSKVENNGVWPYLGPGTGPDAVDTHGMAANAFMPG